MRKFTLALVKNNKIHIKRTDRKFLFFNSKKVKFIQCEEEWKVKIEYRIKIGFVRLFRSLTRKIYVNPEFKSVHTTSWQKPSPLIKQTHKIIFTIISQVFNNKNLWDASWMILTIIISLPRQIKKIVKRPREEKSNWPYRESFASH